MTRGSGLSFLCTKSSEEGYFAVGKQGHLTGVRIPRYGFIELHTMYYILSEPPALLESVYPAYGDIHHETTFNISSLAWLSQFDKIGVREVSRPFSKDGKIMHVLVSSVCQSDNSDMINIHPNRPRLSTCESDVFGVYFSLERVHKILAFLNETAPSRYPPVINDGHLNVNQQKSIKRVLVVSNIGQIIATSDPRDDFSKSKIPTLQDSLDPYALLVSTMLKDPSDPTFRVQQRFSRCDDSSLTSRPHCTAQISHLANHSLLVFPYLPRYTAGGRTTIGLHSRDQQYLDSVFHIVVLSEEQEAQGTEIEELRAQVSSDIRNLVWNCLSFSWKKMTQTVSSVLNEIHSTFLGWFENTQIYIINKLRSYCTSGLGSFDQGIIKGLFVATNTSFYYVECSDGVADIGVQSSPLSPLAFYEHNLDHSWKPQNPQPTVTRLIPFSVTSQEWYNATDPKMTSTARAQIWGPLSQSVTDVSGATPSTIHVTRALCGWTPVARSYHTEECRWYRGVLGIEVDKQSIDDNLNNDRGMSEECK